MRRPFSITALFFLLLILTAAVPLSARAADEQLENKLKAAFLLNFAKFTTWPEDITGSSEFGLCLVGTNPLGGSAEQLSGKLIGQKPIELRMIKKIADVGLCEMIYISPSAEGGMAELIAALGGPSRLTVSDREGFAAQGGIIELRIFDNRLGFIINNTRAKEDGLSLSASLLDLAKEVL
ncbi:MAG: YfiR family protein [Desulfocapsaceae bacterium]|nr:YfiR family protein [Desulfocapsaceae bacterium]